MYGQIQKIEVNTVKEYSKQEAEYRIIDNANIMQSLLTKQFPPERIGGLVNLIAATRPNAPEDEIQKTLVNLDSNSLLHLMMILMTSFVILIRFLGLFVWLSERRTPKCSKDG